MTGPEIRPATEAEFAVAVDWATSEGWNPGQGDLPVFHAADPAGFLMGFDGDGAPVSSVSAVRYGDDFGFLGFYIVRPDRRGTGAGMAIWNAALDHLGGRTVGLDGVLAQQANYERSGFVLAGRNIRHAGVPASGGSQIVADAAAGKAGVAVREAADADAVAIAAYDRGCFPAPRDGFVRDWTRRDRATGRRSVLAEGSDGAVSGYGTIRACREGHKIGPLFAADEKVALALFLALYATLPMAGMVALDTPAENRAAVALAERFRLRPVFETVRMYKGPAPALPVDRIFGVTSFELG
jgi:GNAT superfamily N-acetyltransferase